MSNRNPEPNGCRWHERLIPVPVRDEGTSVGDAVRWEAATPRCEAVYVLFQKVRRVGLMGCDNDALKRGSRSNQFV